MTNPDIQRIAKLHKEGKSHREIQAATGFGYDKIVRSVHRARQLGILPPRIVKASPRQRVKERFQNHMVNFGNIGDVVEALSKEQQDWIISEVRKNQCATVAEYITEIVRDAHAESTVKQ